METNIEDIRAFALSLQGVTEDMPFGDDNVVFRIGGKIFLCLSLAADNPHFALKLLPGRNEELREQHADIKQLEEKYGSQTSNEGASTGTADSFVVVTMTNGQVLYGAIGCEVMLRVGTASVVSPSSPGLIDSTGGTTLDNGAGLTKNHLYMMTISDRGVKATAATTKLLVRGTYEIK